MRTIQLWVTIAIMGFTAVGAKAEIEAGVTISDNGVQEFHLAIGDFYNVPPQDIEVIKARKISDEELPVVFYLAKRAKVPAATISELKLGGRSWLDITHFYGMGADIYYVNANPVNTPPYGKALGYYKNKRKTEWKYIKLTDEDIINLVNLQFIVGKYNFPPEPVIKMRSDGKNFVAINKEFKDGKVSKPEKSVKKEKAKSKGKSKKKR